MFVGGEFMKLVKDCDLFAFLGCCPLIAAGLQTLCLSLVVLTIDTAQGQQAVANNNQLQDIVPSLDSVTVFGAVGDGIADDTVAIQAALDRNQKVHLPRPQVVFRVRSLRVRAGQSLIGPGKVIPCLKGDGTGPTVVMGDLSDPTLSSRNVLISGLNISNEDYPAVGIYNSPNFTIRDSQFSSKNTNTLEIRKSWRGVVELNNIYQSGGGWAVSAMYDVNSLTIRDNVITGGRAGNGIDLGRSQNVRIQNNTMEVNGGYGIRVSGNSDTTLSGVCNAVSITGNYLEQTVIPIALGEIFAVHSAVVSGNYVGNNLSPKTITQQRVGFLVLGRVSAASIFSNSYLGGKIEPFVVFRFISSAGVEEFLNTSRIESNFFSNTVSSFLLQGFTSPERQTQLFVRNHIDLS